LAPAAPIGAFKVQYAQQGLTVSKFTLPRPRGWPHRFGSDGHERSAFLISSHGKFFGLVGLPGTSGRSRPGLGRCAELGCELGSFRHSLRAHTL